jgi:hypothetical protein
MFKVQILVLDCNQIQLLVVLETTEVDREGLTTAAAVVEPEELVLMEMPEALKMETAGPVKTLVQNLEPLTVKTVILLAVAVVISSLIPELHRWVELVEAETVVFHK